MAYDRSFVREYKPYPTRPLSNRKRKMLIGLSEGKPISQAARDAGYAATTATKGLALLGEDALKGFKNIMDARGITDGRLVDKLNESLECVNDNGNPDNSTRLKALQLALKVKGILRERDDSAIDVTTADNEIVIYEAEVQKRLTDGR